MAFSKYGGALNSGGQQVMDKLLNSLIKIIMSNTEQTLSIIKLMVERT